MISLTDERRIPRYAIITTHNRPKHLTQLIGQLIDQTDHIVVIDNASSTPVSDLILGDTSLCESGRITVVRDDEQPPNLYRLWNVGFSVTNILSVMHDAHAWDVAVFNDDVVLPSGWYEAVSHALRSTSAAAASGESHAKLSQPIMHSIPDRNLFNRMCPWAFVVKGELNLRADETLRWWWGDTDFDWQARAAGGVIMIPGYPTQNVLANSTTVGALAEQAGRDRETFAKKWGYAPW